MIEKPDWIDSIYGQTILTPRQRRVPLLVPEMPSGSVSVLCDSFTGKQPSDSHVNV